MGELRIGRRKIATSNEAKVFFPDDGITKGDVIAYYTAAAPAMLPHLEGRPLSLQRYPNGIEGGSFFQKDAPKHYPDWIERVQVAKKGGHNDHVVVTHAADLAYLANNGVLTIHGALSTAEDLRKPDMLIFDLDPSVDDFGVVRAGAAAVREALEDLGLATFVKTTGSRGLHVVSPVKRGPTFDEITEFTSAVARIVVERDPDAFTVEFLKEDRGDRLLIDHFRNRYAQTAVVPYSLRAKPGAPVATPIAWDEVDSLKAGARTFTMGAALERIEAGIDPWKGARRRARSLAPAMKKVLGR